MNLRPDRVPKVRAAQRRGSVEQRRDRLPGRALRGKLVRLGRHAEGRLRLQLHADELTGERVRRMTLVARDVEAGEGFAHELVGDDVAVGIERPPAPGESRPALRVPGRCLARVCIGRERRGRQPWRERPHRRRIAGIIASVGARARSPRCARTFSAGTPSIAATPSRTKCGFCDPVQTVTSSPLMSTTAQAGPMAGVRLERPFVLGADHPRRAPNAASTSPRLSFDLTLGDAVPANMVVEFGRSLETAASRPTTSLLAFRMP